MTASRPRLFIDVGCDDKRLEGVASVGMQGQAARCNDLMAGWGRWHAVGEAAAAGNRQRAKDAAVIVVRSC